MVNDENANAEVDKIAHDPVKVRIIGCGDAFGSGARLQTCFVVDDRHGRFAIDFGASSMIGLQAQRIDPVSLDLVVLSHLHADHFGGVPLLLLQRQYLSPGDKPLTIAGPPGFGTRLKALTECMYPGMWRDDWAFPLALREIVPGQPVEIAGREILTREVNHYAGPEPSTALRITTSGKTIAYSGDTGWNDMLIDLCAGTDLFICDCNDRYDQAYDGHISYQTLAQHLPAFSTKRMFITHLGPEMVALVDELPIENLVDGMEIVI